MASDSYESIEEILEALAANVEALNSGKLSLDELNDMCERSRELYERLVVLRYKVIEAPEEEESDTAETGSDKSSSAKASDSAKATSDESEDKEPASFRIGSTAVDQNQTSLIDAIEEVEEENGNEIEVEGASESEVEEAEIGSEGESQSESEAEDESPSAKASDSAKATSDESPSAKATEDESGDESTFAKASVDEPVSVNDKMQDPSNASLAAKLEKAPIESLRSAISLNQKFQFINELFDGESDSYEGAIDHIDKLTSSGDAKNYAEKDLATKYNWDLESRLVTQMMDLLERRFI